MIFILALIYALFNIHDKPKNCSIPIDNQIDDLKWLMMLAPRVEPIIKRDLTKIYCIDSRADLVACNDISQWIYGYLSLEQLNDVWRWQHHFQYKDISQNQLEAMSQ